MQKCTKFGFGPTPDPAGELTALPRPPSWILGAIFLREGEGERREGRKGREGGRGPTTKEGGLREGSEGRERRGREKGRGGDVREWGKR